jgi:hypothetical protein
MRREPVAGRGVCRPQRAAAQASARKLPGNAGPRTPVKATELVLESHPTSERLSAGNQRQIGPVSSDLDSCSDSGMGQLRTIWTAAASFHVGKLEAESGDAPLGQPRRNRFKEGCRIPARPHGRAHNTREPSGALRKSQRRPGPDRHRSSEPRFRCSGPCPDSSCSLLKLIRRRLDSHQACLCVEYRMAPRAHWRGYLKLSLVSCPISLYPAISAAERSLSGK